MQISICFKRIVYFISLLLLIFPESSAQSSHYSSSHNGMVVSASGLASEIGLEILKKGGNAIDAAVATGFALAVTYPSAGNLGGGGFMVINFADGNSVTIDYREKAPLLSTSDMFLDESGKFISELSQKTLLGSGVPGSVAGLIYALKNYGTLSLGDVIQPAIQLARNGFNLPPNLASSFRHYNTEFNLHPSTAKIFTRDGEPFNSGDLFVQSDLAYTLEQIKQSGVQGFYSGEIADRIVNFCRENGGLISHKDLESYSVVEREPVQGYYKDYKIISMGPPSSGGIALIQLLKILEHAEPDSMQWGSAAYYHYLVEAMKHVYSDRSVYLGDSDFVEVPVEGLTSDEYAEYLFNQIKQYATPSAEISGGNPLLFSDKTETTHYSVYDKFGNAVAVTTTLNDSYGNRIVVEGCGFFMNNEMDDFASKPGEPNLYGLTGGIANAIQPGKRMLSSMTPTIVLKNDKPFLILGSPGGSTIITVVLQVILNVLSFNMDLYTAVEKARIHHQWLPDKIDYEESAISSEVMNDLLAKGHIQGQVKSLGRVDAIMIDNKTGTIYGMSDKRGSGSAAGY